MKWFKFYGQDWLTDPKIISMKIEDKLCFLTLLCLASVSETGLIKDCNEETVLRLTGLSANPYDEDSEYSRAKGCFERLKMKQMITHDNAGCVTVVNFNKRQGQNLTNYERVKRYRERQNIIKNKDKKNKKNVINDNIDDNTNDNARLDKNRIDKSNIAEQSSDKRIPVIIDLFKEVNPSYQKLFGNKTQRKAVANLLALHGEEKLTKVINFLKTTNSMPYFPSITTPCQLEDKWGVLESQILKKKNELQAKKEPIWI